MIRHAALALLLLLLLLLLACPMLRVTGEPANYKRYINAVPYEGQYVYLIVCFFSVQIINDCKNKYCRVLVDGLASIASFETHDISHYGPLFIDASRGFLIVGASGRGGGRNVVCFARCAGVQRKRSVISTEPTVNFTIMIMISRFCFLILF
ncbi:hypothetical protein D917_05038, partial [Trichinella nativa]